MKKIVDWFHNYWYYYKWQIIFGLVFAVFAVVVVGQMITKTEPDAAILYAGPAPLNADQTRDICGAFNIIMDADYNGDGRRETELTPILLMTESQLEASREKNEGADAAFFYNNAALAENRTKFSTQIFAGQTVICLLDPAWYPDVRDSGGFVKLSDLIGYTPEGASDEYSIRLRDLPAAQAFSAFSAFPEDTLFCVRTMSTASAFTSKNKAETWYNRQLDMAKKILTFTVSGS